jgi:hypothetical protein
MKTTIEYHIRFETETEGIDNVEEFAQGILDHWFSTGCCVCGKEMAAKDITEHFSQLSSDGVKEHDAVIVMAKA